MMGLPMRNLRSTKKNRTLSSRIAKIKRMTKINLKKEGSEEMKVLPMRNLRSTEKNRTLSSRITKIKTTTKIN
jgi:hypothetical protein